MNLVPVGAKEPFIRVNAMRITTGKVITLGAALLVVGLVVAIQPFGLLSEGVFFYGTAEAEGDPASTPILLITWINALGYLIAIVGANLVTGGVAYRLAIRRSNR